MSALSIQVPFPVFQGRDGQPLENGYVWIGEPNLNPQTNPVVAYFDAALTITAPQPLRTLNGYVSRAGTPAQIYVDGVNFSILVQDSKGSMVYNFPDGTGISPNADGIEYDPPFTGAVTSNYTVQDKLAQTVSVKDFGAVGDGVTDDDVAIQAAVAHVETMGGGTVYFPFGDYPCSILVSQPNVTLVCDPGTIIRAHGSTTIVDVTATATNFTLDGFDIRGQTLANESVSNAGGTVINTNALHCVRVFASGATLRNFKAKGSRFDGIYFSIAGEANAVIEDFYIGSVARNPVTIIQGVGFTWARGTVYIDNQYTSLQSGVLQSGLYMFDHEPNNLTEYFERCSFTDVIFENAGTAPDNWNVMFHATNIDATNSINVSFSRCRFIKSGSATAAASIRLEDDVNTTFQNITISDCSFEDRVFTVSGTPSQNVEYSSFNNIVLGNASFSFSTTIGDGCYLNNIRSLAGSLTVSGVDTSESTLIGVMSYANKFPKATTVEGTFRVIGNSLTTGADPTVSKNTIGDEGIDGGTVVSVAKRLVVASGTTGQTLLTISGVDQNRVAQVWEVTVNTQAQGSAQSKRQRSQKIAFMVTAADGNIPVTDVIVGYGWADTLSSDPSGGDRNPGTLSLAVSVVSNEVVVTANVTNTASSGANILNVFAVGTGRRIALANVN